MTNDYYEAATIARLSQARSSAENADRAAVEAAFDLLPPIVKVNQNRIAFYTAGGTANAITVAMSPTLTSYETGLRLTLKVTATNTATATINVDGLGARNIKLITGGLIEAGELVADTILDVIYNGTDFFLASPTQRLVSGVANINDPLTFGDTVDVTNGPLTVVGNAAGSIIVRVKAEDASVAGFQIYDNDNTTYRNVIVNNGADAIQVGHASWASQTFLGAWSFGGTMTAATVDINGGAIDSTVIGAATAAAASFTTLGASGATTLTTVTSSGLATLASLTVAGASTLDDLTVTEVTETVYSLTGTDVDPANGTVQTKALTADWTMTESLTTGQAVRVLVTGGDSWDITYPVGTEFVGGSAPTLTGKDLLTLEKIGSDLIIYAGTGIA